MEIGLNLLDTGMSYVRIGLEFVRNIFTKVAGWIPFGEPGLVKTIVFLLASLWIGQFIAKKFTVRPWQIPYVIWTIVISLSIFLNLMYL